MLEIIELFEADSTAKEYNKSVKKESTGQLYAHVIQLSASKVEVLQQDYDGLLDSIKAVLIAHKNGTEVPECAIEVDSTKSASKQSFCLRLSNLLSLHARVSRLGVKVFKEGKDGFPLLKGETALRAECKEKEVSLADKIKAVKGQLADLQNELKTLLALQAMQEAA